MATGKRKRYDGVEAYLDINLASGQTTIQFKNALTSDGGKNLNTLNSGEYVSLSILDANYVLAEIVHLVSYTSGAKTGTIERAQEGTDPAKDHLAGVKVVHSPTADDFFDVQDHLNDPNAHQSFIQNTVNTAVANAMQNHTNPVAQPDPHTQYMREDQPITFPPSVTVPSGSTITVKQGGKIIIEQGGELIVNGDLKIEGTGRFFINGKQLYISNSEPAVATSNMVWLKTFG